MRFQRSVYEKEEPELVLSPQRVRAAERAVQRDHDAVALFPELRKETTVEDRLQRIERGRQEASTENRQRRAREWRNARRRLATLPPLVRAGVLRYWNTTSVPGDPVFLASFVTQAQRGTSFWAKLAELRRLRLVGEKKLDWRYVAKEAPRTNASRCKTLNYPWMALALNRAIAVEELKACSRLERSQAEHQFQKHGTLPPWFLHRLWLRGISSIA